MKNVLYILFLSFFSLGVFAQPSSEKLIRQGASFHDKGRYSDAITCYLQALKVNPSSMSAVYEMSFSYLKMRDYNNAIKYSSQVINVGFKPLLIDAYVVKGTALADQRKLDDAIVTFTQAIERCGNEYLLLYNLGLAYYNSGNTNLALLNLRKAIELDATHSSAFLLYAYALRDSDKWLQSFFSFHFFLLLEPNTKRSRDAFGEMYKLIDNKYEPNSPRLRSAEGVDVGRMYDMIHKLRPSTTNRASQYTYFKDASKAIFETMGKMQKSENKGLLWEFFTPTYDEILHSGHFDAYIRYVSVSYFPESLSWWSNNKNEVDDFIEWFEQGTSPDSDGGEADLD